MATYRSRRHKLEDDSNSSSSDSVSIVEEIIKPTFGKSGMQKQRSGKIISKKASSQEIRQIKSSYNLRSPSQKSNRSLTLLRNYIRRPSFLELNERRLKEEEIDKCKNIEVLQKNLKFFMKENAKKDVELKANKMEKELDEKAINHLNLELDCARTRTREETFTKCLKVMEDELCCPVCDEVYIEATILHCGHMFCSGCITKWAQEKKDCPNCRTSLGTQFSPTAVRNYITKFYETLPPDMAKERHNVLRDRHAQSARLR